LKEEGNHVLVGGGIGVPPLLELAKQLKGNITVFIGARTAPILIEEFEKIATVHVATDDGSVGFKGNIVALMDKINPDVDFIYSCGPNVMLKYLSKWALEKGIDPQVSMEERMACGIGACVGCAIKVKSGNDWEHKKVCKDGPVFLGSEVIWND
ncbi:MAG: dihydroorotate dehydrogenase electron transfer subunit, partial [Anaerotignaceae bacterium]